MSQGHTAGTMPGAIPPPPGQISNFLNPPNHDAEIVEMHTVCVTLITLFVGMRVYIRAFVLRQFALDDGRLNDEAHWLAKADFVLVFCIAGWVCKELLRSARLNRPDKFNVNVVRRIFCDYPQG